MSILFVKFFDVILSLFDLYMLCHILLGCKPESHLIVLIVEQKGILVHFKERIFLTIRLFHHLIVFPLGFIINLFRMQQVKKEFLLLVIRLLLVSDRIIVLDLILLKPCLSVFLRLSTGIVSIVVVPIYQVPQLVGKSSIVGRIFTKFTQRLVHYQRLY